MTIVTLIVKLKLEKGKVYSRLIIGGKLMERLSKTAKGLDTFFKVIYYIWLVGTVLSVVVILFALYLTTGGMNLFGDIGISMLRELDFGSIAINLSSKVVLPEEIGLYYCIVSLIVGFLGIPITYLMIRFIRNILKPMIIVPKTNTIKPMSPKYPKSKP